MPIACSSMVASASEEDVATLGSLVWAAAIWPNTAIPTRAANTARTPRIVIATLAALFIDMDPAGEVDGRCCVVPVSDTRLENAWNRPRCAVFLHSLVIVSCDNQALSTLGPLAMD